MQASSSSYLLHHEWTGLLISTGLFSLSSLWMLRFQRRTKRGMPLRRQEMFEDGAPLSSSSSSSSSSTAAQSKTKTEKLLHRSPRPCQQNRCLFCHGRSLRGGVRQELAVTAAYYGLFQNEPAIVRQTVGYLRDLYRIDALNFCREVAGPGTCCCKDVLSCGIGIIKGISIYMDTFRRDDQVLKSCIMALITIVSERKDFDSDGIDEPTLRSFKQIIRDSVFTAVVEAVHFHDSELRCVGFKLVTAIHISGDESWNAALGQQLTSTTSSVGTSATRTLFGSLKEEEDLTTLESFLSLLHLVLRNKLQADRHDLDAVDKLLEAILNSYVVLRQQARKVAGLLQSLTSLTPRFARQARNLRITEQTGMAECQRLCANQRIALSRLEPGVQAKRILEEASNLLLAWIQGIQSLQQDLVEIQQDALDVQGDIERLQVQTLCIREIMAQAVERGEDVEPVRQAFARAQEDYFRMFGVAL